MFKERTSRTSIRSTATVAIGLLTMAANAQYVHLYTIYDATYSQQFGQTIYRNETGGTVNFQVLNYGNITVNKNVSGSGEPCPWSSKFTPIGSSQSDSMSISDQTVYGVANLEYVLISWIVEFTPGEQGFDPASGGGGGPGAGGQIADDETTDEGSVGDPPVEADFVRTTLFRDLASYSIYKSSTPW